MQDLTASVQRVLEDWDGKRNGGDIVVATDPASGRSLVFTRLEVEDNMVKLWTGDYEGVEPEYVIVNPPTKFPSSADTFTEDPMTALAVSIFGVRN